MFYVSQIAVVICLLVCPPQADVRSIKAEEAHAYVGQVVQVCGTVTQIRTAVRSRGVPTFVRFGQGEFTALIWQWQRHRFGDLKSKIGKQACVTGQLRDYRGKAQMTLTQPSQLGNL